MLVTSTMDELLQAQEQIEDFKQEKPTAYQQFLNIIQLTRQLQFGFQYMGVLLMDKNADSYRPEASDDYILSVYKRELNTLKQNGLAEELHQLWNACHQLSFPIISKLMLGASPKTLVGPAVVR